MNIALLNKKVTFQKAVTETDAIGNHMNGWQDWYTCMATISGEGGNEVRDAGQILEKADLTVTVRYCFRTRAVKAIGYRIIIDGVIFNITSVDHFSYKNKALKFMCQRAER